MKTTKILALVTAGALCFTLSACSSNGIDNTVGEIPLTEDYNVSSMPAWADSSVKILETNDWQVSKMENMLPAKVGYEVPALYMATNKDNTCNIIYNIGGVEPSSEEGKDSYALTEQGIDVISFDMNNKVESKNTDAYVHIDNDARLQLLSVKYTREVDKTKSNNITAFRVLSNTIPSPYSAEVFPSANINPKVDITYSCSSGDLDMSLWNKVLDSATLTY